MPDREREMSTLELHAHTDKGSTHVATVHRGPGDNSPLQLISGQELARLRKAEADLAALRAARTGSSDAPAA